MTKKNFIALADDLIKARAYFVETHGEPAFDDMVDLLARFCKGENGRFDRERFIGYIGGENGPNGGKVKAA